MFNAYVSLKSPLVPIANTCSTGYPHDSRADNAAYRHDRRADNAAYWHDRRADSLSRQRYRRLSRMSASAYGSVWRKIDVCLAWCSNIS